MSHWWQKVRKIVHLPRTRLSPTVVLARMLEKAQRGTIKSVVVVVEWENGDQNDATVAIDWSEMSVGTLMCMAGLLSEHARRKLLEENPL